MKHNSSQSHIIGGILGFLAAFGGVGCIVTGMRFEGIAMVPIAFACAAAAILFAVTAQYRFFPAIPGALALIALWMWFSGSLKRSAGVLISHISYLYHLGYGWDVVFRSSDTLYPALAAPAFYVLGILLALGMIFCFLRCKSLWPCILLTLMPILPCMILTDTPPASGYLLLQVTCLSLLLLVRIQRRRSPEQSLQLLKLASLPMAAVMLILFLLIPQGGYSGIRPVDTLIDRLFPPASGPTVEVPVFQGITAANSEDWIDLTTIGPLRESQRTVMEVLSDRSGTLYLKGTAYDTYLGTGWDITVEEASHNTFPDADLHTLTITTRTLHDILYLPPYAHSLLSSDLPLTEKNGQVANPEGWGSYTLRYGDRADTTILEETYLQLPESTQERALQLLQQIPGLTALQSRREKAGTIVSFVAKSARYDLNTEKMPADSGDFALWFLENSDTGYCTHFASAATVLLRAAGIPCRYVTGYLVSAQADQTVVVFQRRAHAWVECYISGEGWVTFEPTPGDGLSQTVGGQLSETTAPTETTQLPTEGADDPPERPSTTEGATIPSATDPGSSQSTIGGADAPSDPYEPIGPAPGNLWIKPLLTVLAWILGVASVVIAQWRLRVMLRRHRRNRGKPNRRALARWREVELYARLLGCKPPAALLELAQKARFSNHTLTRQELGQLDLWLRDSEATIRQRHLGYRLLAQFLFALY